MKKRSIFFFILFLMILFSHLAIADTAKVGEDYYTYEILDDDSIMITGFTDRGQETIDLVFPDEIDGRSITKIGANIFSLSYSPLTITMPTHITEIDNNAFYMWGSGVKKIIIPEDYHYSGNAFYAFPNLLEYEVLGDNSDFATIAGVLYLKPEKKLLDYPRGKEEKSFEVPKGIKIIGENAFIYNDDLNTVIIPDTVVSIEDKAFYSCNNLKQASLPASLQKLGSLAFSDTSIDEFVLGSQLTKIGANPFAKLYPSFSLQVSEQNPCLYLDGKCLIDREHSILIAYIGRDYQYTIPDGIKTIGDYAFEGTFLKSIDIPSGVEVIGDYAFWLSSYLSSISIPDTVKSISTSAIDSYNLKAISIPASVEYIDPTAFNKRITLNVFHNSYAEQYAKDNGIYYTFIDEYNEPISDDISWLNEN